MQSPTQSIEHHSIREGWINLILHTTAFINQRKQDLLIVHAVKAFWRVIQLIAAEVFLAVISLPVYIAASSTAKSDDTAQYKLRRVVTLSIIFGLLIIWLVKLIVIVALSFQSQNLSINQTESKSAWQPATIQHILASVPDDKLTTPSLTKVIEAGGVFAANGQAIPKSLIVMTVMKEGAVKTDNPKMYMGQTNDQGQFSVSAENNVFDLPDGNYVASAQTYDPNTLVTSPNSQWVKFTASPTFKEQFLNQFDRWLNILAFLLIFMALGVTILVL